MRKVIVFGAGGAVGEACAHALAAAGWRVVASIRTKREDVARRLQETCAEVRRDDLEGDGDWREAAASCDALVFTTMLNLTVFALRRMQIGAQRIVAFSSNNIAIQPEAPLYVELAGAERSLREQGLNAAILRPTLIYGDPRLPTLTRLMRAAKRSPYLPMPGSGRALLQPVFFEDLGRAAAWLSGAEDRGTFAIGGPDTVTMRSLYRAVIRAGGAKARIVPVPAWALRAGAPVLRAMNFYSDDQILRADRDRLVAPQTPPPREIEARVGLREGLARLAAALRGAGR